MELQPADKQTSQKIVNLMTRRLQPLVAIASRRLEVPIYMHALSLL